MQPWYVYLLRCSDGSLYCGVTNDLLRRVAQHNGTGKGKGAKYTAARRPVTLVWSERCESYRVALHREWQVKQLTKRDKEILVGAQTS